ncbi:MAG: acetyl-CoA carboxylase biotin carboxylase subunit [Ignavibacteria bacterium]|nr:acetyl-CoA carboxylase biotin carboxylase subunit [Ignavibacteria bacterium]
MKHRPIKKILIANRGEIAVRIIRTCRELGIQTVAVFSEADRTMPHVLLADEAYLIGPPPSAESYLRSDILIEVAGKSKADAIHPGYGFLSEKAQFSRLVSDSGLIFIGPSPEAVTMMGDKTEARKLMMEAGVPVVPGTKDPISAPAEAAAFASEHGYPVLIKAAAGGGGKGMRVVAEEAELPSAFRAAKSEALASFGDGRIFVEKYLAEPRHVEFQILADAHGSVVHLGERECSIQRRHQKIIEESPSVIVDEAMRKRMGEAAVMAAQACGYVNAGTVEFLVDRDRKFYFLEMNTRLQVEHPVTELRTGIDLVAEQIRVARHEPLGYTQSDIRMNGHAIECRIYAEDPANSYMPSTGTILHLKPGQGPGVRDDRGVEAGNEISVYYDPMISKLVVWAGTREQALRRMIRALGEYEILGVATNIPLNLSILRHPDFVAGNFDTHFLALHPDILKTQRPDELEEMGAVAAALARSAPTLPEVNANSHQQSEDGRKWHRSRILGMQGGGRS